jgi:hypothetical protein
MNRRCGYVALLLWLGCPGSTAIDASGTEAHRFSANFVSGRLAGVSLGGNRFVEGGDLAEAFVAPAGHDYRRKPDSVLVGRADPSLAPPRDFTGTVRPPPVDVGAEEER